MLQTEKCSTQIQSRVDQAPEGLCTHQERLRFADNRQDGTYVEDTDAGAAFESLIPTHPQAIREGNHGWLIRTWFLWGWRPDYSAIKIVSKRRVQKDKRRNRPEVSIPRRNHLEPARGDEPTDLGDVPRPRNSVPQWVEAQRASAEPGAPDAFRIELRRFGQLEPFDPQQAKWKLDEEDWPRKERRLLAWQERRVQTERALIFAKTWVLQHFNYENYRASEVHESRLSDPWLQLRARWWCRLHWTHRVSGSNCSSPYFLSERKARVDGLLSSWEQQPRRTQTKQRAPIIKRGALPPTVTLRFQRKADRASARWSCGGY